MGIKLQPDQRCGVFRPLMSWENQDMTELLDAYVDLVEFSKDDSFGFSVANESRILLRKFNWDAFGALPSSTTTSEGAANSIIDDSVITSMPPVTADKLKELLDCGAPLEDIDFMDARYSPWYLRSNYGHSEILFHVDGSVKGGTVAALVTRLTSHEYADSTFNRTFLVTWRSFTDADKLFDLLVREFYIQPPDNIKQGELDKWKKLKQHTVQVRVLNTLRSLILDEDMLEREVICRMRDFVTRNEVYNFAAAKVLLTLIERYDKWDKSVRAETATPLLPPPASICPKSSGPLKLLDIDALEMARQLTILDSRLYMKINSVECLERASNLDGDYEDNISRFTKHFNRLENWFQDNVLRFKNDARIGGYVIKYLIAVAHHCRDIHNFSSMVAIVSALSTIPVRGLKRAWEHVPTRFMRQLNSCEAVFDPNKNFTTYRRVLGVTSPPCVPYFGRIMPLSHGLFDPNQYFVILGVFLAVLNLVQKGSRDILPGNLVNFRKRGKVANIMIDIKRWQLQPHNFHSIESVLGFIEKSLELCSEQPDMGPRVWNSNLQRELQKNEEEMIHLLKESGL
ncbi:hypothetical protein PILCRDRAFT_702747 [Piloderma croceum F 1598]|uniref:Ras-GEF domain-containing protein n=1 Tax=Piloderma croceum (strain F 1598) TaxID=765440 RepID=A0A0C3BAX1_PILCF|nr:hypothetical protein PILCRDRAFT_702747 [Piloderma croceum F 1598]